MKNITLFLVTILFAFATNAQQYDLSLNLEKGKEYFQSVKSTVNVLQELEGTQLDNKIEVTGKTSFLVKEITTDGYEMEAKYVALSIAMEMPTHSTKADTETPDPSNPMYLMLSSFVNKTFRIGMTRKGEVKHVSGLQEIFDSMFDEIPSLDEQTKKQMLEQLRQSFGEKSIKTSIETAMTFFPANKVAVGDSWNKQSTIESGMKASYSTSYQLKEAKDAHYIVDGNATVISDKTPVMMSIFRYVYDMKGTQKSQIRLDARTGWPIEVVTHLEMEGTMEMDGEGAPQKYILPMKMKSQTVVTNN